MLNKQFMYDLAIAGLVGFLTGAIVTYVLFKWVL